MEQHSSLNFVDIAVFAAILISGGLALWRGFVRELLSLAAWSGAAMATVYFFPILRPWMHQHVKQEFATDALTGLALFCLALAILIPIGFFISGLIRGRALTAIDRSLGFVFGLARGGLVVCLLFLITLWIWPEKEKEPEALAQAKTRPFLAYGAEVMKTFLPEDEIKKATEHMNAKEEKPNVIPLDQPPTPTAVTTTVTVKADPVPEAKPADVSSSKDQVRQVIDQLLNPSSAPSKP